MPALRSFLVLCALLFATHAAGADREARAIRQQADRVVAAVRANDPAALDALLSPYAREHAQGRLFGVMRARRLHEIDTLHWNPARHTEVIARLEGMATLVDGSKRWIHMRLVKRRDQWLFASLGVENADAIDEPAAVDVPHQEQLEALLAGVLEAMRDGERTRSFDRLFALMPSDAGERFGVQDFNEGLLGTEPRRVYEEAARLAPVLDVAPRIDDDALLRLEGHYPTEPPLRFQHAFQHERGAWRLLRLNFLPPAGDAAAATGTP